MQGRLLKKASPLFVIYGSDDYLTLGSFYRDYYSSYIDAKILFMKILSIRINKKMTVIAALVVVVLLGVAGTTPASKGEFKNLQVLPKDISKDGLEKIMKQFESALDVNCSYCHVKQVGSTELDFASDAKSEKESSRAMMRMTLQINKDNFEVKQPLIGDSLMIVTCYTCHRGTPYPDNQKEIR